MKNTGRNWSLCRPTMLKLPKDENAIIHTAEYTNINIRNGSDLASHNAFLILPNLQIVSIRKKTPSIDRTNAAPR